MMTYAGVCQRIGEAKTTVRAPQSYSSYAAYIKPPTDATKQEPKSSMRGGGLRRMGPEELDEERKEAMMEQGKPFCTLLILGLSNLVMHFMC